MGLNKADILNATDQGLSVFKHYLNFPFKLGRNFKNPLYEDKNASCNVYYDRKNYCYRIKDFGNDEYSGDCFYFVAKLFNLNCNSSYGFVEVLERINKDLHLNLLQHGRQVRPVEKSKVRQAISSFQDEPKEFKIHKRNFNISELQFWEAYGIDEATLAKYNVCSMSSFKSINKDGHPYKITSNLKEPIFGYVNNQHVKLYRPNSSRRFLNAGKIPNEYCFGLEQLMSKGDLLFITGGEKDVLALIAHNFQAICFNSETSTIPIATIQKLSRRFKHIVLLYDTDPTGIKCSSKQHVHLKDFRVKQLRLPLSGKKGEKDIADFFRLGYTAKQLTQLFIEQLDLIYNETMASLKSCEIHYNYPPPTSESIITANMTPIGTQGNLLCITGGEGTGKSNYVAAIIAGSINPKIKAIDTLGLTVLPNANNKAVLFYDTEQSENQLYKNVSKLVRRAKLEEMPSNFHAYCLTCMTRKNRLQAIIESMDKFHFEHQGIQLVVIDGVADLVRCANDEAESIALVEELYRLAGIYNTCIITVLHFVPNGLKLRGHLGSELQRKAAAILSIDQIKEASKAPTSIVKAIKIRDGSPFDVPIMQFAWDKQIGMHTYLGEKSNEARNEQKVKDLTRFAKEIFSQCESVSSAKLCKALQQQLEVKERTAKSYIKFLKDKGILLKDPKCLNSFIIEKSKL